MRKIIAIALALCAPWPLSAQNAITQEGTVLQNAPMMFRGNNRARQGAPVGGAPTGQIVTTGDATVGGRCDYGAPLDQPDGTKKVCIDGKRGQIVVEGSGGLTIVVDGTTYTFPGSVAIVGSDAIVGSNAALKTLPGSAGKRITRLGFTVPGDGGLAAYNWSGTNCAVADDGAQVQPTGVTGCWVADFSGTMPTPLVWGAKGDGVANDAAPVQAAINARGAVAGTLYFDAAHKYLITSGLASNSPIHLIGSGAKTIYTKACSDGIIVNSDITALTLTGIGGSVQGICFQMATTAGTRSAGAAIKAGTIIGLSPADGQGRLLLSGNTIVYPYDGIVIGGNTTGSNPGGPTQTNSNNINENVVISPSHTGIMQGLDSTGISTNGARYVNNQIACFDAYTNAIGYDFHDGDFWLDATNGGPYNCNIGVKIAPGANQGFNGSNLTGVMGDTVGDVALLIDSTSSSSFGVNSLSIVNWWAATYTTTTAGGGGVRIQDTGGNNRVHSIQLVGGVANICTTGGGGSHDITGIKIKDDVFDVMIANNRIFPACVGDGGVGISINTPGIYGTSKISVTGNHFDAAAGNLAVGIAVAGATDQIIITDNMIGGAATTPITWTTGPNSRARIKDNASPNEIEVPTITGAAAIAAPFNEVFAITGTTTISTMANMWSNREVWIIPGSVFAFATGGGTGKFCNGLTTTVSVPVIARWIIGNQCWHLK